MYLFARKDRFLFAVIGSDILIGCFLIGMLERVSGGSIHNIVSAVGR